MPESNVAGGDAAVQQLIKLVGIRIHEDRLPGAACGQRRNRGLGRHVLQGIHADAQMRQERLWQNFAQFIIDGRGTGRVTVAAAITAERAEKGAVRRTGMQAVQAVDNVQSFFVRLKRLDGFRKLGLRQRTAPFHPVRNASRRIETLVLQKENNPLSENLKKEFIKQR